MTNDILKVLVVANLAGAGACLLVLATRLSIRRLFGAGAAYALWAAVPIAMLATALPARTVTTVPVIAQAAPAVETFIESMAQARLTATPVTSDPVVAAGPIVDFAEILVALWAAGAIAAIIIVALGQRYAIARFGRLTRDPSGKRLWRASNPAAGPALIGLLNPKVVLPSDFSERFDTQERAVILAHEQAHLAAGHLWLNALAVLMRCLSWFNPLVHIAANIARADQELACDAAVLVRHPGERRTYADALLKSQIGPRAPPLGCAWPHRHPDLLKKRLEMLAFTPAPARRLVGIVAVTSLATAAGYASWAAQPAVVSEVQAASAPAQPLIGGPTATQLAPAAPETPVEEPPTVSLTNAGGVWDGGEAQITLLPKIPQEEMERLRAQIAQIQRDNPSATVVQLPSRLVSQLAVQYGLSSPSMLNGVPGEVRVDWASTNFAPDGSVNSTSFNTVGANGSISTISPTGTVGSYAVTRIAEDGSVLMDRVMVFDDQPILVRNMRITSGQSATIPLPTGDTLRITPTVRGMNAAETALANAIAASPPPTSVMEYLPGGGVRVRTTQAPAVAEAQAALRAQQSAANPAEAGR